MQKHIGQFLKDVEMTKRFMYTTIAMTISLQLILEKKINFSTLFFFFLKQCSILDNASKLPSNLVYHTNEKLSDIVFNSEDIVKVISGLDPNKAHGHDIMI